jgi:hypothetical protein
MITAELTGASLRRNGVAMEPALDTVDDAQRAAFRQRVRGTAFWAIIGGGLMLYFGIGPWVIPTISPLYTAAAQAYIWTLRIGGGAMIAVAALCLTGWSLALLVDAVACAWIAMVLALTGAVFLSNGETNGLLSLVFAIMFGGAGRQSWNTFLARPRPTGTGESQPWTDVAPAHPAPPKTEAEVEIKGHSVIEAIRRRRQGETAATLPPTTRPIRPPPPQETPRPPKQAPEPPPADAEPAGGFLAALGREDREPKKQ